VSGALLANYIGKRIRFESYKRAISVCYVVHGGSYVLFSQAPTFVGALFFIALSRAAVAVSSVLNTGQLLRHVSNDFRGRVFSTIETWTWATMMVSMAISGLLSDHVSPRTIGLWAGVLSSTTAIFWGWGNMSGRLPEPVLSGVEPEEVEVHGDPTV
jgi:MFS family permease